jgi:alpha-tubulin suppressor-like RCC1 family protein
MKRIFWKLVDSEVVPFMFGIELSGNDAVKRSLGESLKPEQLKRDNFSRRTTAGILALAVATAMSIAIQSSAATLYFPGPSTNATLLRFAAIGCGGWHSLGVLQSSRMVMAWGDNNMGQTNVPAGLSNVVTVAGGEEHSLALRSDSTVAAWGDNSYGESSVPSGLSNVVAIAGGGWHSLALRSAGDVVAWGDNRSGESYVPGDLFNAVAIAAGASNNVAVKLDGTVEAWGDNTYGQSTVPVGLANIVAVAAGQRHGLALKSDGTVVAWGDNSMGQANVPAGLSGVITISAGAFHNLALKSDGTVLAWGANDAGQSTVPAGLSNVVAVAAGQRHSLALKSDGTIVAWGDNSYEQSAARVVYTVDLNLQDTVDEAHDGDTILVAPGQYNLTNQVVITKAIVLQSSNGAAQTILNAMGNIWCLWISNSLAVADGFTLRSDNLASFDAGGIDSFEATVQNCIFTNFSLAGPGPGTTKGTSMTMHGGVFSNSVVFYNGIPYGADGNAVYCAGDGMIIDCQILGTTGGGGTGIHLENSQLRNSVITGTDYGGPFSGGPAVYAVNSSIADCTIAHNYSQAQGGGAYLDSCLMDRCIISGNACGITCQGGGIFETNSLIRDSLIVENSTGGGAPELPPGQGGGVYMQGGALVNCTVSGNSVNVAYSGNNQVPGHGAGVYTASGGITNCIIFGNGSTNWFNAGAGVFDHSCTTPDPGGVGNVVQDPQFVDLTNGNYHLATNSPCLAVGVVQSWMTGAEDLDGNPRTVNGVVDMGAYQNQSESQKQTVAQPMTIQDARCVGDETGNDFVFSFPTQTNHAYTVQYTYSLAPADWQTLTNIPGDGAMMNCTNRITAGSSCFYRVVVQ